MALAMSLCALAARAQDYPTPGFDRAHITTEQELRIAVAQPPPIETAPPAPENAAPTPEVPPNDASDEDDDEDETPWLTYAAIAGFVLFAAIVWLVISRAGRSAKG